MDALWGEREIYINISDMLTHSRTVPRLVIEEKIWKTKENEGLDRPIPLVLGPWNHCGKGKKDNSKSIFTENPPKISQVE